VVAALVLLAVVAVVQVYRHHTEPERLRRMVQDYLRGRFGPGASVERVQFSLWDGLDLQSIRIPDPAAAGIATQIQPAQARNAGSGHGTHTTADPLLVCPTMRIRPRLLPALRGRLVVQHLSASGATLTVYRDVSTGRSNLADLLEPDNLREAESAAALPSIQLYDARVRLGRADGTSRRIVEDLALDILASPTAEDGCYELRWEAARSGTAQGRSRIDLRTAAWEDLGGGLPWMSVEGFATAAESALPNIRGWCELLGLSGRLRLRDFHFRAPRAGPEAGSVGRASPAAAVPVERRATVDLREAKLSIPLDDEEKALPAAERYLVLTAVEGRLDVGPTDAVARVHGMLHDSPFRVSVTMTCPSLTLDRGNVGQGLTGGTSVKGPSTDASCAADFGLDVEASVERFPFPRKDAPDAPAEARFVARWQRLRDFYRDFDPHGVIDLSLSVARAPGADAPVQLRSARMQARGGDTSYRFFPYRLSNLSGTAELRPEGITLTNLTGEHDGGVVTVNGTVREPRWRTAVDLRITGRDVPLDQALHDALNPRYQRILDRFELAGRADLDVVARRPQGTAEGPLPWQALVDADFKGINARFRGFPYPVRELTGRVRVDSDTLTVADLTGSAGAGTVIFGGSARFGADGANALDLHLAAEGIPFDGQLDAALPAQARGLVRRFAPSGRFDLSGTVTLAPGGAGVAYDLDAELGDMGIVYDELPVPLQQVAGRLRITPERIEVRHLGGWLATPRTSPPIASEPDRVGPAGPVGPACIVVNGSVALLGDQPETRLDIACTDLNLDPALLRQLPDGVGAAWADAKVAGPAEVAVWLRRSGRDKDMCQELDAIVTARGLALREPRFPLAVADLRGTLAISSDSTLDFDLAGRCGQGRFAAVGQTSWRDGVLAGSASLSVEGMPLDDELRAALPWRLRRLWNSVEPAGTVDLELTRLSFEWPPGGSAAWDIEGAAELRDGAGDLGVKLGGVFGELAGSAGASAGPGQWSVTAAFDLDRVNLNDYPMTAAAGRIERYAGVGEPLAVHLDGQLFGGAVQASAEINADAQPAEYACAATMTGLRLVDLLEHLSRTGAASSNESAAPEPGAPDSVTPGQLEAAGPPDTAGRVDGHLYLTGPMGDSRKARGGGGLQISDAQLFRLPPMLSLLDALDLPTPDQPGRQTATAEFYLLGPVIELRDLQIRDDTLSLTGSGRIERDHQRDGQTLDLRLVATSPQRWFKLPVLTEFVEGASRELVELEVHGSLANPVVTARPLRGVGQAVGTILDGPRSRRQGRQR